MTEENTLWTFKADSDNVPVYVRRWMPPNEEQSGKFVTAEVTRQTDDQLMLSFKNSVEDEAVDKTECFAWPSPNLVQTMATPTNEYPLAAGEFCEVASERDQGMLFARFLSVEANGTYKMDFPLGPTKSEMAFPASHVRRALLHDTRYKKWQYVDPTQKMSYRLGSEIRYLNPSEWVTVSSLKQLSSKAAKYMKALSKSQGVDGGDINDEHVHADTGKKVKRTYTRKVHGAPKRPRNAYIFYMNDFRDSVRKEHPGLQMKDVTKILSQKWKESSPAVKAKYEAKTKQDKLRYAEEFEKWTPPPTDEKIYSDAELRKDKNAPKMYRSAYALFMMEYREREKASASGAASNDRDVFTAVSKKIGAEWRNMAPDEKATWIAKSDEEKRIYEEKKSEYIKKREYELRLESSRADPSHPPMKEIRMSAPPGHIERSQPLEDRKSPPPVPPPVPPRFPADVDTHTNPLGKFTNDEIRANVLHVAEEEAYLMVVEALREQSEYNDVLRRSVPEYLTNATHPDWKAFLVAVFGFDKISPLFL